MVIIRNYTVMVLSLTDDIDVEMKKLINDLKSTQATSGFIFIEISLKQFAGSYLTEKGLSNISQLTKLSISTTNKSSVYIFGDKIHENQIVNLFNPNNDYITSDTVIKFASKGESTITLKS